MSHHIAYECTRVDEEVKREDIIFVCDQPEVKRDAKAHALDIVLMDFNHNALFTRHLEW